jgi:hypothetical protein
MLWGRLALAFTIASTVGLLFTLASTAEVLLPALSDPCGCEHDHPVTTSKLALALHVRAVLDGAA